MRQIILEMLLDLALQLDGDAALELKQRRRLHFLFWLVLCLQILFILFIGLISLLLFIVGWDEQNWGLLALAIICSFSVWLQLSKLLQLRKR